MLVKWKISRILTIFFAEDRVRSLYLAQRGKLVRIPIIFKLHRKIAKKFILFAIKNLKDLVSYRFLKSLDWSVNFLIS